jgi:hypothetical protein
MNLFKLSLIAVTSLSIGQTAFAEMTTCTPVSPTASQPEKVVIPAFRFEVYDVDGTKITKELPAQMRASVSKAIITHSVPDEIELKVKFDVKSATYTTSAKEFNLPKRLSTIGMVRDRLTYVHFRVNHDDRDDGKIPSRRISAATIYSDGCAEGVVANPEEIQKLTLEKWQEVEGVVSGIEEREDTMVGTITKSDGSSARFLTTFFKLSRKDKSEAKKKLKSGKPVRLYYSHDDMDPKSTIQIREVEEVDYLN